VLTGPLAAWQLRWGWLQASSGLWSTEDGEEPSSIWGPVRASWASDLMEGRNDIFFHSR